MRRLGEKEGDGMIRTAWVGVLAFLADRISKQLVIEWMELGAAKVVWPGVLNLTYTQNTGMAFSILADRTWLLIVLSAAALIVIVEALRRALRSTPLHHALLWLLVAGGLGNLLDRLFFGYVIDFLHVQFVRFPVFNVADACLTVSALLLIVALLRNPEENQGPQKANEQRAA